MCYDSAYLTKRSADYARRVGYDNKTVAELQERFAQLQKAQPPQYHASGFAHPGIPVLLADEPRQPYLFHWGLIPFWVKNEKQAYSLHHKTLNARCESMFSKPAYRAAARYRRCLLVLDGFYEHHHYKGSTYPFYLQLKSEEPMIMAGLWEQWDDEWGRTLFSASIVTTQGNALMAKIHNNPKLSGPRMPVLLPKGEEQLWLNTKCGEQELASILEPYPAEELKAHPVGTLRGKKATGNRPEAQQAQTYPELPLTP